MDRKDCLASAFQHLTRARELLIEAELPGGELPRREVLEECARLAAEAHLQFEHLLAHPDPYADKALRPGLNYDINRDPRGLLDQLMDRPKEADHG